MLLYHGSTVAVEIPRLVQQTRFLDFGSGFYTTANRQQAVQFAIKVKTRRGGTPIVSAYNIDEKVLHDTMDILVYEKPDEAWLDFVAQNRTGVYTGPTHDVIIGPVANDDVYRTVSLYLSDLYTKEETLKALKIKKLFDQYVFRTEAALRLLRFIQAEEVIL